MMAVRALSQLGRTNEVAFSRRGHSTLLGAQPFCRRSLHAAHHAMKTIFALATGSNGQLTGATAVHMIRLSGPHCRSVADRILLRKSKGRSPMEWDPRRLQPVQLIDPFNPTHPLLDRALAVFFPAPNSFTGEDILEIHLHGSPAVVRRTLELLSTVDPENVQLALPGEFSKRAVMNGKMDLVQAEHLSDLLQADTLQQAHLALDEGNRLRTCLGEWRERLVYMQSYIQAAIDFGEDEVSSVPADVLHRLQEGAQGMLREIEASLDTFSRAQAIRSGCSLVLLGRPNAGKSSLMNLLAQRKVSIVSAEPGTTRDVVSTWLDLGGFRVELLDTAGLRAPMQTAPAGLSHVSPIEREGMELAKQAAQRASVVLLLVDVSRVHSFSELESHLEMLVKESTDNVSSSSSISSSHNKNGSQLKMLVLNKIDCLDSGPPSNWWQTLDSSSSGSSQLDALCQKFGLCGWQRLSCTTAQGFQELLQGLTDSLKIFLLSTGNASPSALVSRERHRVHLVRTAEALSRFLTLASSVENMGRHLDLSSEEIRVAAAELSAITHASVNVDEVLTVIFREFCIGK